MRRQGYIEDFDKEVAQLKKVGADFRLEFSGQTRTIYLLDGYGNISSKRIYFGHRGQKMMKGLELVTMVRREVRKKVESGEAPPANEVGAKVVCFHPENLMNACETQEELYQIDLNACYWVTAFHLGIISEKLFEKGWKIRKQSKLALLASIGSLNKKVYEEGFEYGKSSGIIRKSKDDDLRPYYWAVISKVNAVMHEAIGAVPKHHFMMWLTDCIYVRKESKSIIQELFGSLGYESKHDKCHISKVEMNKVFWVTHKTGEEKFVYFNPTVCIH